MAAVSFVREMILVRSTPSIALEDESPKEGSQVDCSVLRVGGLLDGEWLEEKTFAHQMILKQMKSQDEEPARGARLDSEEPRTPLFFDKP